MYIYGASGHGKVIADIVELIGLDLHGFIDDNSSLSTLLGYKIYPLESISRGGNIVLGIGNNKIRKKLSEKLFQSTFISLVHPSSNLSKRSFLGIGTVVMAGATINCSVDIGNHCIINTNSSIDHDCVIEDFVHIAPNAALAGNVTVKEGTHIGIGASVIQGIEIGKWVTVGAGAVVLKNVPDYAVVVGNPAKIIKLRNE